MSRILRFLVVTITFVISIGCTTTPEARRLREAIASTPAKNFSSYHFDSSTPLIERVTKAPDIVLKYLREADQTEIYSAYTPSESEMKQIQENFDLLPAAYEEVLSARLIGIYFIRNLIGSGIADYVLDEDDQVFTILVLNPEVLTHNISDWLSYREGTAFANDADADTGIKVQINCGTTYTGFTYVLFHETSHITDYIQHYTPYVEDNMRVLGLRVQETPFSSPVWKDYDLPRTGNDFPLRDALHFYGTGSSLPLAKSVDLYKRLAMTPFASLYGSRNWAEDFAEYMTWYWLAKELDQPYEIQVFNNEKLEYRYQPMSSQQVLRRAQWILALLS